MLSSMSYARWTDDVDSPANLYVRRWMRHFPLLRATCVENWIDEIREAVLPTWTQPLTAMERDLLIEAQWRRELGRRPADPDAFNTLIVGLEERILTAQTASPVGAAFVRLGYRAPTDSPVGLEGDLQVDGGPEALVVLLDSERVFEDLCLSQECSYEPSVTIRPWVEIAPENEVRAFIRNRELVGLSQRALTGALPGFIGQAPQLETAVKRRCAELADAWPLDDLVVDLACLRDDDEATVIDLHPWLPWTDPKLFSWDDDSFERYSYRYLH
jgi:hypothetical protein